VGIANVGLQFVAVVGLVPTPEERTAQQFAKEQARQQQSAEKVKVGAGG
jgi:predicted alternative tryptophan synthase beta-subunit